MSRFLRALLTILFMILNNSAVSEEIQDSCNAIKTEARTNFRSPGYPEFYGGSLICQFQLNLNKNTVGVKMDFIDLDLPGNYYKNQNNYYYNESERHLFTNQFSKLLCDSDWFFIKGFPDWMPDPRCGNFSGYSEIDRERYQKQVTIVFIMSSDRYKWNIRLTQISSHKVRKMDYCLVTRMESWNKQIGSEFEYSQFQKIKLESNLNPYLKNILPWEVTVRFVNHSEQIDNKESRHLCTGIIVDNRHVLVSASAFFTKENYASPMFPLKNLKVLTRNGTIYEVEMLTFHFNFGTLPFLHDDIAVIRTKTSISFDQTIRPIEIPQKDWILPDFSTTKKEMPTFIIPGCVPNLQTSTMVSVLNESICTEIHRKELEAFNLNLTAMQSIGKYEGVLKTNWICLQYGLPIVEIGCPLIQLDSRGRNPKLIGIFSHSSINLSFNKEIDTTGYFTKIQTYWNWIFMAIS